MRLGSNTAAAAAVDTQNDETQFLPKFAPVLFSGGVVEAGQVGHVDCDVDRMGRHDTAVVPTHWYLRYPLIMAYSSSIISVSFPHEKSSFMYVA